MIGDRITEQALLADLQALGVARGRHLLVHSSLRGIGPVAGGAATVLRALQAAIGPDATLVMPSHTAMNSLSSRAFRTATAGFGAAELAKFVAAMPGFDPASSPSIAMGHVAESLRNTPGAVRSTHPQTSFTAIGRHAVECMAGHELACHLGDQSPLGWLYRAGAAVLLLGVGYSACTAFHLAEYRLPGTPRLRRYRCFVSDAGARAEQAFCGIDLDDGDFAALGAQMDEECFVTMGRVGAAGDCRYFPLRAAVDFAVGWQPFRHRRAVP
jgi:aminoglycoside 3-N-acetyltransferase